MRTFCHKLVVFAFSSAIFAGTAVMAQDTQPQAQPPAQQIASPNNAETQAPNNPPPPATPAPQRLEFQNHVQDIHFAFNSWGLSPEDHTILQQDADWMKAHPDLLFTIEGDADERGSIFYNLYLSQERAVATRNNLESMGVNPDQILFANGWGKLYPTCEQGDESCWAQNRRSHFAAWPPLGLEQRAANQKNSAQTAPPVGQTSLLQAEPVR
jgi:peptidoglycan-associated lipoprotein